MAMYYLGHIVVNMYQEVIVYILVATSYINKLLPKNLLGL